MPDAALPYIDRPKTVPPAPTAAAPKPDFDRALHVWQSRFTGGRSPSTLPLAMMDWAAHAMNAPHKMGTLGRQAATQWRRLAQAMMGADVISPKPGDNRFAHADWQKPPFNLLVQSVLLGEEFWDHAVHLPDGVSPANERLVAFTLRQFLDMMSPSNFPWANPEVIAATRTSAGKNFVDGFKNFLRDQTAAKGVPAGFTVGGNLAATPGHVVFRNTLMELIQYTPTTAQTGAEPVLFVPAWIMKYYILDLSAANSLAGWLVAQGRTVFMISWKNPDAGMRDTALGDYRTLGVMAAIDAVSKICGEQKIHATGYCLGGTLLTITASAMARDGDDRLATLSLFAAQTDFSEAGELQLFITNDQLSFLNDMMQTQGFLDSAQMGGAFAMLQSNELVFSHAIRSYMLGEQTAPYDMLAWNADGTRLPARMHIEYLRSLYLHNDLSEGRFMVENAPVVLDDLHLPIFIVGTERDHIAPWHSVYKLLFLTAAEITFILTSGGHNAGIVSEPGHLHRHFRMATRAAGAPTLGPDAWEQQTPPRDGSWWPEWGAWLDARSGKRITPPKIGAADYPALGAAPGTYVLQS
jgi:polyhydroxyalkanoate synthase